MLGYIVAVTVFILLEFFFFQKKQPFYRKYFWQDVFYTSLNKFYAYLLMTYFAFKATAGSPLQWKGFGPLSELAFIPQLIAAFIIRDFISYWIHRGSHSKILWPFHQIHHQAEPVDWLTSYRFHPVNFLFYVLRIPFLFCLGFNFKIIIAHSFLLEVQNYLCHTNVNWKFRAFRKFFVSPHLHRLHHEKDLVPGNSNFATVFSFWDVIFGSFYYRDEIPIDPGLSYKYHQGLVLQLISPFKESFEILKKHLKSWK